MSHAPPHPPEPKMAADLPLLRRSEPRDSMFLIATLRRPGGAEVSVKLRNLSPRGMMSEAPGGFVRGDQIEVGLRGVGTVPGQVVWMTGGRLGVRFDRAVDPRLARVTWWPDHAADDEPGMALSGSG